MILGQRLRSSLGSREINIEITVYQDLTNSLSEANKYCRQKAQAILDIS